MIDEEALLTQFTAQFDQQTDDSDTTQADSNDSDNIPAFDADRFLQGLDAIFARHAAASEAAPYLEQAMSDAENAEDDAGLLTVLNETMGFYRSQGWHDKNQWIVQRTIELALRMGLEGSETWATTLINCATAMRAAKQYDQAEDLYTQALHCAEQVFSPDDRRIAALHNDLSMLYSETDRTEQAEHELRKAIDLLASASENPSTDIDLASSYTNLALMLLADGQIDQADRYARKALAIHTAACRQGKDSAHVASALAGMAQVRFAQQRFGEAAGYYRKALAVIEKRYGRDTEYWRTTDGNLRQALDSAAKNGQKVGIPADINGNAADCTEPGSDSATLLSDVNGMNGMEMARRFWEQAGKPMLQSRYPDYAERIAVGLVGYGSECFGFDDALSRDHDFGARFLPVAYG